MDKNFRVSFDFDSCLSEEIIQKIAKTFILGGAEVFIVTSRSNKSYEKNVDLYQLAHILGINKENIHFTDGQFKWQKLNSLNINIHFDDMEDEVHLINANGGCAILFNFDAGMTQWLFDDLKNGKLHSKSININQTD
jgi:hypothetical protein